MIFLARLNKKTASQELPVSSPDLYALGKSNDRAQIYTRLLIGQTGGGRTWRRIKSITEFPTQMCKVENIKVIRLILEIVRILNAKLHLYLRSKILETIGKTKCAPNF